jgi:hypothetical protein
MTSIIGAQHCKVLDIYAIPDYTSMFEGCFDKKFGSYCKGEQTQHQFLFEAKTACENFPLGCKVTYRAYCRDQVMEIVQGGNDQQPFPEFNISPRQCQVITHPQADAINNIPEGIIYKNFLLFL